MLASLGAGGPAAAQTQAEYQYVQRLGSLYEQYDRAGKWQDAHQVAQQYLAYAQERRLGAEVELAGYESMARSLQHLGQYRAALAYYDEIILRADQVRPATNELRSMIVTVKGNAIRFAGGCHARLGEAEQAFARYQESVAYFDNQKRPIEAAEARTHLARALHDRDRDDESLAMFRAAIEVLKPAAARENPPDHIHDNWANALMGMANVYRAMGRYDLAEPANRQALDVIVRARGWNNPRSASVMDALALIYFWQGRHAEAEPLFVAAIKAYGVSVGLDHVDALRALNNFSRLLAVQHRFAEAEPIVRHVVDKRRATDNLDLGIALVNLANVLQAQDRFAEAEPIVREALAWEEQRYGDKSFSVTEPLRILGSIRFQLGDHDQALAMADRVLAIYDQYPAPPGYAGEMWTQRGMALWGLGRRAEAYEALQKGIAAVELQRAYLAGGEQERAVSFGQYASVYDTQLLWQGEESKTAEMFATIESMKARSFLDELRLGDADLLAGVPAETRAELTREGERLRRQLAEAEERLSSLEADRGADALERRRQASAAVKLARDELYQHLQRLKSISPVYRELLTDRAEPLALAVAQQKLLRPDDLLLSYHLSEFGESYVIVVRHDGARFARLELNADQAKTLGIQPGLLTDEALALALQGEQGLLRSLSSPKPKDPGYDKLFEFWQILIPESERQRLAAGAVRQLIVLPDGPLALLPFEALVVEKSSSPKYLLDVGPPVVYAPSASVLMNLAQRQPRADLASEPVLTLGDPNYARGDERLDAVASRLGVRSSDQQFRSRLSRLPYSGNEARWFEEHFAKHGLGSVRLTADKATEGQLRKLIERREIVHLACHGMADHDYGNSFGCLALAAGNPNNPDDDGYLYAAEIRQLPLAGCELAILSACETNYGPHQTGEGVWNLSRAFLVAGARRVVASNWLVDDEAGATLVSYFAAYLAEAGKDHAARDYAQALQRAKQQVRAQPRWAAPFYWSSLVLVGPR